MPSWFGSREPSAGEIPNLFRSTQLANSGMGRKETTNQQRMGAGAFVRVGESLANCSNFSLGGSLWRQSLGEQYESRERQKKLAPLNGREA